MSLWPEASRTEPSWSPAFTTRSAGSQQETTRERPVSVSLSPASESSKPRSPSAGGSHTTSHVTAFDGGAELCTRSWPVNTLSAHPSQLSMSRREACVVCTRSLRTEAGTTARCRFSGLTFMFLALLRCRKACRFLPWSHSARGSLLPSPTMRILSAMIFTPGSPAGTWVSLLWNSSGAGLMPSAWAALGSDQMVLSAGWTLYQAYVPNPLASHHRP